MSHVCVPHVGSPLAVTFVPLTLTELALAQPSTLPVTGEPAMVISLTLDGVPGTSNCRNRTVSALVDQFENLSAAARSSDSTRLPREKATRLSGRDADSLTIMTGQVIIDLGVPHRAGGIHASRRAERRYFSAESMQQTTTPALSTTTGEILAAIA